MGRTITDKEIALIKAMILRGVKNKDIQFYFNRPERPVNSGRISGIRDGSYSNSSEIPAAMDRELDIFLAGRGPSTDVPGITIASVDATAEPSSASIIRAMFGADDAGDWRLVAGETDTAECKLSFNLRNPAAWLRAVAALANNSGGYVFFGVADKDPAGSCRVVGLANEEFKTIDIGEIRPVAKITHRREPVERDGAWPRSAAYAGGNPASILVNPATIDILV